ncbi:MAG: hypothetical protein ABID38_01055 [Candidatus Diapherotrites archaeon]
MPLDVGWPGGKKKAKKHENQVMADSGKEKIEEILISSLKKEIGGDNVFFLIKMEPTNVGWRAEVKINNALYEIKLNKFGELMSYSEISKAK